MTGVDGYRLDVGLPGHRVRYVLPEMASVAHRVVMGRPAEAAAAAGAKRAVLVATEEGRALYLALGWSVAAEISAAYLPEGNR